MHKLSKGSVLSFVWISTLAAVADAQARAA